MASPQQTFAKLGRSTRGTVDRIMAVYSQATESEILEGKVWYGEARALAEDVAGEACVTVEQAAVAIAQLSPRLRWDKNVAAIWALVRHGDCPGVIGRSVDKARLALVEADPWVTFGKAPKTRAFASNILGNEHAVTVDVWAARIAGFSEQELSRVGVYEAIAHAYRLAAKRVGITPAQMQAITWVVARNRA